MVVLAAAVLPQKTNLVNVSQVVLAVAVLLQKTARPTQGQTFFGRGLWNPQLRQGRLLQLLATSLASARA